MLIPRQTKAVSKKERYAKRFGPRAQALQSRMQEIAKSEGLNFKDGGLIAQTFDSHRIIRWALNVSKSHDVENLVVEELFKNYFGKPPFQIHVLRRTRAKLVTLWSMRNHLEEEKNIADFQVLADAVQKAGLNRDDAIKYLESGEGLDEIKVRTAESLGTYSRYLYLA